MSTPSSKPTNLATHLSLNAPTHDPKQHALPSEVDAILNHPSLSAPTSNRMNEAKRRRHPNDAAPTNLPPQFQLWYKEASKPIALQPSQVHVNANGAPISAYCLGMRKESESMQPNPLDEPEIQCTLQRERAIALKRVARQKWKRWIVRVGSALGVVMIVSVVVIVGATLWWVESEQWVEFP